MGTSSSTRKITVINDGPSGVIKISNSVVYRLKGELDNEESIPRTVHSTPEPPVPVPVPAPPLTQAVSEAIAPPSPKPKHPPPSPRKAAAGGNEEYWRQLYQESRSHADLMHKETAKEFQKGLQEVESLFSPPNRVPICENLEAKVLECYLNNPKTSLECSQDVKDFFGCVDAMRLHALAS